MNVLAIDCGEITGFASSHGPHGTWSLGGHTHPGSKPWYLFKQITEFGNDYPFDLIIVEGSYPVSRRGADRLEWLRGAVAMAAHCANVKTRVIAPSSLKLYATGSGKAEKHQMMAACLELCGIAPKDSNHADALLLLHLARVNKPAPKIVKAPKPRKIKTFIPPLPDDMEPF